jgi:hypothetical protein
MQQQLASSEAEELLIALVQAAAKSGGRKPE